MPNLTTSPAASPTHLPDASLDYLATLPPSERMPVLFIGHGSPMNAIEDNAFRRSWQALGEQLLAKGARPRLILCVSAHWLTRGWQLTAMADPRTIHDFGGFPQELFDQQYPAPGDPDAAQAISAMVRQPGNDAPLLLDRHEWGLDHGAWSVLKPMFPDASIPVIQLGMDYSRPPADHAAVGQQLRALRDRGVLIVGSGNIVHNLRAMRRGIGPDQAYDWTMEFDQITTDHLNQGNLDALSDFQRNAALAANAHPTWEHYLPLLYAAGAVYADEAPTYFNDVFDMASLSMRSVVWSG